MAIRLRARPAVTATTAGLEEDAVRAQSRRGLLIGLPSLVYLVLLFAAPLLIVLVYSFGTRSRTGRST